MRLSTTLTLIALGILTPLPLPVKGTKLVAEIEVETSFGARGISLHRLEHDYGKNISFEISATQFRLSRGKCVMAFNQTNNTPLIAKLTIDRPIWILQPPVSPGEILYFIGCSQMEVESMNEMRYRVPRVPNAIHGKFCGCINVTAAESAQLLGLVDGRQSCVKLFQFPACEGDPILLGSSNISANEIKSITKCNPSSCFSSLIAVAFEYELAPVATISDIKEVDNVHIRRIFNNGSGSIQEVFSVEKTYTDKISLTRRQIYSNGSSSNTSINLGASLEAKVAIKPKKSLRAAMSGGVNVSGSLSASFQKAWQQSNSNTDENVTTTVVETKQTRKISQAMTVPPCTSYEVSSSITMLDDVDVEYSVFYRVSFRTEYLNASSPETIQYLNKVNWTFVEVEGEHTAIYVEKGISQATLGLETKINADANTVDPCNKGDKVSNGAVPSSKIEFETSLLETAMLLLLVPFCLFGLIALIFIWAHSWSHLKY